MGFLGGVFAVTEKELHSRLKPPVHILFRFIRGVVMKSIAMAAAPVFREAVD
jgi:hypothetical protein